MTILYVALMLVGWFFFGLNAIQPEVKHGAGDHRVASTVAAVAFAVLALGAGVLHSQGLLP